MAATMAERLPEITLTDPNNRDSAPSPAQSPIRNATAPDLNGIARSASGRPTTPSTSRTRENRPESSGGWSSSSRLIRTRSPNAGSTNGSTREDGNGNRHDSQAQSAPIDPLSQHLLQRATTPVNVPTSNRPTTADTAAGKRNNERRSNEHSPAPAVQTPPRKSDFSEHQQSRQDLKKGVKAVSFISRLIGSKKKEDEELADDESVSNEGRPEGNDAEVFAQPVDNIAFNPRQPQPPAYIKVRSKYKKERDFDHLFLAQELDCRKRRRVDRQNSGVRLRRKASANPDAETVWAMEFSKDGNFLAAAGVDGIVRVWAVLSSLDDRHRHEMQESTESEEKGKDPHAAHLSAPVFQSQPVREFEGHSSTVLDLSWSKNNFLLSSSMDKTVRLWHVSRPECLCTFKHNDIVPSISFHPKDDRFFLAGSLDSKLRLWSIPDKSVAFTAQVSDMITAVAFTPDGKCAMAGCLTGLCMFYETEGMRYQSQIHVRSSRGQNAKGSKITGIQAHYDAGGHVKLLITSNDSRIRLYNFRDKSLELKLRGNVNNSSQIRATLSSDGRYVICGSEDRKAYIWSFDSAEGEKRDKHPVEMFEAHDTITTVVCFAPVKTRLQLGKSEDPVYDLCNPPPVTLLSRAERAESQSSSKPPTENGSMQATPADLEGMFEKPKASPSYSGRAQHRDGNIIVTADFTGKIKVFRQDCAWSKRKLDEWDRGSIFSKRNGKLSRTASVATKASQRSVHESRTSMQGPSDRIMSWRQGIISNPSIAENHRRSSKNASRSISPRKSVDQQISRSKWEARPSSLKSQAPISSADISVDIARARGAVADGDLGSAQEGSPKSAGSNLKENPLLIQGGRSYAFWDTSEWKLRAERMKNAHESADQIPMSRVPTNVSIQAPSSSGPPDRAPQESNHLAVQRPPLNSRGDSFVSELSDERSEERSEEESDSGDTFDDAPESQSSR